MSSKKKKINKISKKATKPSSKANHGIKKTNTKTDTQQLIINQKIYDLEEQLQSLSLENELLKKKLEQQVTNHADESDSLVKHQKVIQSLQKEVQELLQDLETADIEIDEYLKAKEELEIKNEFLTKELSDKDHLLGMRNQQFEKLAQDYEQVYKKIVEEERKIKAKKTTKKSSRKSQFESLSQLQDSMKTIEKLEKKLKSKDEEIDELINRLEIQEIRIEELEDELENELKNKLRIEKAYNKVKGQN